MYNAIFSYLADQVQSLGYFNEIVEFAHMKKQKDGEHAPMKYCGNGEFKDIITFDQNRGTVYFRLLRPIQTTSGISRVSGETPLNITLSLRAVACVKNDMLKTDDAFNAMRLTNDLKKVLSDYAEINSIIGSRTVRLQPVQDIVNIEDILREEIPASKSTDVRYNYTMAALDFNLLIEITAECLMTACEQD